jgi:hypothetical protein
MVRAVAGPGPVRAAGSPRGAARSRLRGGRRAVPRLAARTGSRAAGTREVNPRSVKGARQVIGSLPCPHVPAWWTRFRGSRQERSRAPGVLV